MTIEEADDDDEDEDDAESDPPTHPFVTSHRSSIMQNLPIIIGPSSAFSLLFRVHNTPLSDRD